ncbi:hypothetical protein FFLO_00865 [Filobasidium floriforme]|uniref:GOLD domain-containing protein n=1 Tax=Filobasidium floriforme TaxID=5210 RepID=A0A8K0JQP5_9TREE|nr:hypothetical protein FFLO_00865 [Filobasidium floriforme]
MLKRCMSFVAVAVIGLSSLVGRVEGVKFEMTARAYPETSEFIWNFANAHTLVIVTANVSPGTSSPAGGQLDRIDVEIVDGSHKGNVYLAKKNIKGETRLAITTHEMAEVGVCLRHTLEPSSSSFSHGELTRIIDLDVDIGSDAVDYNAIANQESLSILEVEMLKLEGVVKEISDEMDYLKRREERMRDTNESTNARVQNFAIFTIIVLIALGVWQILHLRSFFKRKYLID